MSPRGPGRERSCPARHHHVRNRAARGRAAWRRGVSGRPREHGGVDDSPLVTLRSRVSTFRAGRHGHPGNAGAARPSADARCRSPLRRERGFSRDQDIRRVRAARDGGDHQPLVVLGGEILRGWTATSISSRSSASRIVSTNSPFRPAARRRGRPRRRRSTSGRSRVHALLREAKSTSSACTRASGERRVRSGASLRRVEAQELHQQLRVQVVGSGLGPFLQLDDRIVQELRSDASRQRLDRGALVGRRSNNARRGGRTPSERPRRPARAPLGSRGRARRNGGGPPIAGPPRHDLVARDSSVVRRPASSADRESRDVDQRARRRAPDLRVDVSGTARSSRTSGRGGSVPSAARPSPASITVSAAPVADTTRSASGSPPPVRRGRANASPVRSASARARSASGSDPDGPTPRPRRCFTASPAI